MMASERYVHLASVSSFEYMGIVIINGVLVVANPIS
jgi:hypothetical protein